METCYLNIGCGKRLLPGFLNIDVEPGADLQLDVTKGLPFADGSVDAIFSEHFFEHLTQGQGLTFLRESRRILKPGGRVRIAMPDLDEIVRRYTSEDWRDDGDMFKMGYEWVDNRSEMLNICMREWGHQWLYNEEELTRAAILAGLRVHGRCPHGESDDPNLCGLEYRDGSKLIMELDKPIDEQDGDHSPLVSVLIPAYNPSFFHEALKSALEQTYSNLEIVICDDSRDGTIEDLVDTLAEGDGRVRYERNVDRQGGMGNYVHCLSRARGEYIKFLNDDDILHPLCVERMVACFLCNPGITLVTSHRQVVDAAGDALPDIEATRRLVSEDSIVDGLDLANVVLHYTINCIGEPTTVMFRRTDAQSIRPHLMSFGGREMRGVGDVALWLNMLSRGHAAYLATTLSYFRLHNGQRQRDPGIHAAGLDSWHNLRYHANRLGLMDSGRPESLRVRPFSNDVWDQRSLWSIYPRLQLQRQEGMPDDADEPAYGHAIQAYGAWCGQQALSEGDAQILAERMAHTWRSQPTFHLIAVLQPGQEAQISDTLAMLGEQLYAGWGLSVLAATPSPDPIFDNMDMIEWVQVEEEFEIALQRIVRESPADWIGLIDVGDRLAAHALIRFGDYTDRNPNWQLIYSDEDLVDSAGRHSDPRFRPDFNFDLLRSTPYMGAFGLIRREALLECGGIRWLGALGIYDLAFRVLEQYGEAAIGHIADVLYHRQERNERSYDRSALDQQARDILESHLGRVGVVADVKAGYRSVSFNVEYRYDNQPLVSIIIPTRDQAKFLIDCVDSLLTRTTYRRFEVIIVDNGTNDPLALSYLDEIEAQRECVRILRYRGAFNYSAMNNWAAREARGEYLLLLNNDTVIVQEKWLGRMLAHARRAEVGVVGARLVFPDQRIQHAGVVLGIDGTAHHPGVGMSLEEQGYMGRLQQTQNFSAVTGACLMVRKKVYFDVGGLDEKEFPVLFNDVDLCLKVGKAGYKIVWTPYATVVHHGSGSLGGELGRMVQVNKTEQARKFVRKWAGELAADPAYNRNLTLRSVDWGVETQVTAHWDVNFHDRPRVLAVPVDASGSPRYRVLSPLFALEREAYAQIGIVRDGQRRAPSAWEVARLEPDVLLLQMFVHDHELAALRDYRTLGGPLRIFALDDLVTNVPDWSPARRTMHPDIERRLHAALKLCDRLIVNTAPLREAYGALIDDVRVVPNYLERKVWGTLTSERRKGAKPRVGWAGAQQHQGDLQLLLEVVRATAEEVDWVFMGMWLEAFKPYVGEFHRPVPFDEYPAKLAALDLDLAVAPLSYHPFNESKSNLRVLEYGALGWPVVCTDIEPYREGPVRRVPNEAKAWIAAIRERVHDLDATAAEGDRLREWVHGGWMLEDHLDEWLEALAGQSPVSLDRAAGSSGRQ